MLKSYFKSALKNLKRNPFFSIINIVCLSIGLTGILLSYLLIFQEFNIVKKHDNYEKIYQLENKFYFENSERISAGTSGPQAPYLKEHFPEILKYARIGIPQISEIKSELKEKVQQPARNKIACADREIFKIFSFSFIYGNSNNALDDPNSIILTEETSKKFFGDENPVGNVLFVNRNYQVKVTGVVNDLQIDTRLDFDYLLSFNFLEKTGENITTYTNNNFRSFVLVDDKGNIPELNKKIKNTFNLPSEKVGVRVETSIAPIAKSEISEVIYIIAILSVVLLIITCLNFISLTTAQLTKRTQEIIIRKIIGAGRRQLIKQYLMETLLISLLALSVSFVILEFIQPTLQQYLQLNIRIPYFDIKFVSGIMLLTLIIGTIAGIYPAYLSSLCNPINAFHSINMGKSKSRLRKVWIFFQLITSVFFILCITFLYKQFFYMHSGHQGISKENVYFSNVNIGDEYEAIKTKLSTLPFVSGISCASDIPTSVHNSATNWGLQGNLKNSLISYSYVDHNFAKLFNISVIKGEFFSEKFKSNSGKIVINESAASYLGIENPVGETCYIQGEPFQIAGIVKNYNYQAMKRDITPLALILDTNIGNYLFLKLSRNDYSAIKAIQKEIEKIIPGKTFEFYTLEDYLDEAAKFDLGVFRTAFFICCIGIFISCLGLLALTIFLAAQRTKEIGIRKVLGGSIWDISFRYLKESLAVYLIAVFTSSLLAHFVITKLLQQYAYRISLDLREFLAIGTAIILLLCLVVLIPYLKAATANPVESLKYE